MISVKDEILSGEPLYHITETVDSLGNKAYRIELATNVTQAGTPLNKALFDSIQTDLTNLSNNKLNTSAKATQAQAQTGADNINYMTALRTEQHYNNKKATQTEAEAGTNDTKHMTPLNVKQALIKNKIVYTPITLSTSQITTLNLAQYMTTDTVRLDIVMNVTFGSNRISGNYKDLIINGSEIRTSGMFWGSTVNKLTLCSKANYCDCIISIYPKQRSISIKGVCKEYNQSSEELNYLCAYESISNISLGLLGIPGYDDENPENPVAIIQYKV